MKKSKMNLLRAGRLALAVAASLLFANTAVAALTTYTPGDVFIGFRQTGVANTLVAKIGTARDFLPTTLGGNRAPGIPYQVPFGINPTNSTPVTNLSLDLAAVFGSSWAFNPTDGSGVRWGVVGWTGNTGEVSSVDGLALRSLFVTRGRTNPSEQTNVTNIGNRGGFATEFTSFAYGLGGGSYINQESTTNSSVAYIGAASDVNNWSTRIQGNAGFGLGSNRAVDQTPLSGAFSGPTNSVLDLWLSPNTGSTLVSTNTYLGSFTLSADGSLTFTPVGSAPPSEVPVITSASSANGTVGVPFSYTIAASNNATSYGANLSQAAGAATENLSINPSSGLISGTPINAGIATVPISATNSAGTGNASLTITIAAAPVSAPVISSAASQSGQVGTAFSYQIAASNNPTSFDATGLPAGLSVNSATGLISGTPTTAGNSTVTISATNSGGTGNATLAISIAAAPVSAPVISSAASQSGQVGTAFSYQITASNNPTSYGATGLPAGLSVNSATGLISGSPTTAGNSSVTVSASNSGGTGNATLAISIAAAPVSAPVISSAASQSGQVGTAFSYQIAASNNPTSFGATGLPAGLSVNSATGLISGTPTTAGNSTVTISATNSGGTGNSTLAISIAPAPVSAPVISSATSQSGQVGTAFNYQITASNNPTSYGATGLPAGLSVNSATGLISGSPTTAGNSSVTVSASNSGGTGNSTLAISIAAAPLPTPQPRPPIVQPNPAPPSKAEKPTKNKKIKKSKDAKKTKAEKKGPAKKKSKKSAKR